METELEKSIRFPDHQADSSLISVLPINIGSSKPDILMPSI
jgi:hypothetical protein